MEALQSQWYLPIGWQPVSSKLSRCDYPQFRSSKYVIRRVRITCSEYICAGNICVDNKPCYALYAANSVFGDCRDSMEYHRSCQYLIFAFYEGRAHGPPTVSTTAPRPSSPTVGTQRPSTRCPCGPGCAPRPHASPQARGRRNARRPACGCTTT